VGSFLGENGKFAWEREELSILEEISLFSHIHILDKE
jgi:hypothetical protein